MKWKKVRKLPIEVEVIQNTLENQEKYMEYLLDDKRIEFYASGKIVIETLEGSMICKPGDYIIKGIKGEIYPVRKDIYLESYEDVE